MKVKYILSLVCLITLFASCSKDTDPVLPNYPASVLTHPENGTLYTLEKADADKEVLAFTWTGSTQDELPVASSLYYLQVDIAGRNFASAVTLLKVPSLKDETNSTIYSGSVTVKELDVAVVQDLKMQPDSLVDLEFRVITNLGSTVISSSASNIFTAQVIPYDLVRESLFFVGNMFADASGEVVNGWNESNYKFIFFRATPDASVDTYTGKFLKGGEFKLFEAPNLGSWNIAYGSSAKNSLSLSGGNIGGFETTGYYTVTADIDNLSYSIVSYDASQAANYMAISLTGIGSDVVLTQATYDPHMWAADDVVLTSGNAIFKANDKTWGGKTFPYGGGSEDNITVEAGTYYIVFNDLTGQYVFYDKTGN